MGYLFAVAASDLIDSGATISRGATFSLFVRFRPTSLDDSLRLLVRVGEGANINAQLFLSTNNSVNANFFGLGVGTWNGALAAGSLHSVLYTYDGSAANLYGDTDATPKATVTQTESPPTPSHLYIGNAEPSNTLSADATIYEVAWWAGTVLSGADSAALGGGNANGIATPTDYWPLVDSALALYGGHNGTVTGAALAAHAGNNLYGAGRLFGARRSGLVRAA